VKLGIDQFYLNHYTGLSETQKSEITKLFNNFDRFTHMIDDANSRARSQEQNASIILKLGEMGVFKIEAETFGVLEDWLNVEDWYPQLFIKDEDIYKHLEEFPNVGFSFYIENDQIKLFDWLPNTVVAGLYTSKERYQLFTMTTDIQGISQVWMILTKNGTIVEKFFVGEKRFFTIEDSEKTNDLKVIENLDDLDNFDNIDSTDFSEERSSSGKIKWIQNINGLYSEVIDLQKLTQLFSSTYNGRKYLCSGVAVNKQMNIIAMVLFLNLQEEFARKVKEDCKKDIVFYTYDPRLTGKQITTEVSLNETTEMLSAHEFNLTTRYYRNCTLNTENRNALIKRYGNCLYTIINDLFLKV
jgi:hypothetical protein